MVDERPRAWIIALGGGLALLGLLVPSCALYFLFPFVQLFLLPWVLVFGGIGYVGGRRAAPRIAGATATVLMGAFIAYDITENTCGYRALPNLVLGALWIIPPVTLVYLDWWWFWYVLGVPPLAAGIAMLGFARGRHIRWRAANAGETQGDAS